MEDFPEGGLNMFFLSLIKKFRILRGSQKWIYSFILVGSNVLVVII